MPQYIIATDASLKPGQKQYAYIVYRNKKVVYTHKQHLPAQYTKGSVQAEGYAIWQALRKANRQGWSNVKIYTDSQIAHDRIAQYRQQKGNNKLWQQTSKLANKIDATITWLTRDHKRIKATDQLMREPISN